MKKILIGLLILNIHGVAQQKYITKTGTIHFEASVPSFEEVSAKNNSVTAIINSESGEFAALALVKAFRFKNALMEEHFNENYAESHKFPKATFKGQIEKFRMESLSASNKTFKVTGELTFHGVKKVINNCEAIMSRTETGILMEGKFKVKASDFDIDIPKIVRNKIADDILIEFRFELFQ